MGRATENQVKFLQKNGYTDSVNYTYEYASQLIGDIKNKTQASGNTWNKPTPTSSPQTTATKEYHLTPEAINAHALSNAIAFIEKIPAKEDFGTVLMRFKKFIETGELK